MLYSEIVALGPDLCKEAMLSGKSVNEAYLVVHRVFTEFLREDLKDQPASTLREKLIIKLRQKLQSPA